MNYKGTIIEESLDNLEVLKEVKILSTEIEPVTERHRTPWIKQWTLYAVEIVEGKADQVADLISRSLDKEHSWYADYKNDMYHYIIYGNKIFKIDLSNPTIYQDARQYGISIGIPDYQVDFGLGDKTTSKP